MRVLRLAGMLAWWAGALTLVCVLWDGFLVSAGAYGWRGQEGRFILTMRTAPSVEIAVTSIAVNDVRLLDRDLPDVPSEDHPFVLRWEERGWHSFRVVLQPGQSFAVVTVTARDGMGVLRVIERPVVPDAFEPCVMHVSFTPLRSLMSGCVHSDSIERW